MKTMLMKSTLAKVLSLTSLLAVMACAGEDPNSGRAQNPITSGQGQCEDDEEEANDKIYCSVDTDCDSDEFCLNGRCTGYDGDVEDEEGCEGEDADEDEDEADDKITCSVTADCDPDEVCTNGLCTGLDGDVEDDEEEEADDKITCSVDGDCDSDEVCTNGLCT